MANVLRDDGGVPVPQYLNGVGSAYEAVRGDSGDMRVKVNQALPPGDANIGNVDVLTLPALPTGTNTIGKVGIDGSIPAGTNTIGIVKPVGVTSAAMQSQLDSMYPDTNFLGCVVGVIQAFVPDLPSPSTMNDALNPGDVAIYGIENMLYNGSTWDRQRANIGGQILASAARTATIDSSDQTNHNGQGLHVIINVSAGTGISVVPKIQAKDPVSGNYYDILVGAAITATGMVVLRVFPGADAVANLVANDIVPRTWRFRMEHGNTNSVTYSAGYFLGV